MRRTGEMVGYGGARCAVLVVGAGAAGLFAATWAARSAPGARVVALDSSRTPGAKILVAGGGRCNVTHHSVDESAYAGSSRAAIGRVLRRFGVDRTVEFFRERGVTLKREATGKLFPTTDRARTVLDALLSAARDAGVEVVHPFRVEGVRAIAGGGFIASGDGGAWRSDRLILCTGGKSLPKSGSDGTGLEIARSLGHTLTERVFPALVPLLLPAGHALTTLSGLSVPGTLEVRSAKGKRLAWFTDSVLFTHFGLSGPVVLDISRYFTDAAREGGRLVLSVLPGVSGETLDRELQFLGSSGVGRELARRVPERLARVLLELAGVEWATPGARLTREARRAVVSAFTGLELPVIGDRGWNYAEVTAGGVPLKEVDVRTMESRACPGLYLAGEVLDVDGRIGGFNFQWAWASGYVAGLSAAESVGSGRSGREHDAAEGV